MTETLEHNSATFTFERVDESKDLPREMIRIDAQAHEDALKIYFLGSGRFRKCSRRVTYWTPKHQIGKHPVNVYAFTKGD